MIRILYMRPGYTRDLMCNGFDMEVLMQVNPQLLKDLQAHNFEKSHQLLAVISPKPYLDPEVLKRYDSPIQGVLAQVYEEYQGEIWSPKGEARELIKALGLNHTSMCVGDIIDYDGAFYMVQPSGFYCL